MEKQWECNFGQDQETAVSSTALLHYPFTNGIILFDYVAWPGSKIMEDFIWSKNGGRGLENMDKPLTDWRGNFRGARELGATEVGTKSVQLIVIRPLWNWSKCVSQKTFWSTEVDTYPAPSFRILVPSDKIHSNRLTWGGGPWPRGVRQPFPRWRKSGSNGWWCSKSHQ